MDDALRESLVRSRIRLRSRSPFFGVLLSYLKLCEMPEHWEMQTAATDSKNLFVSKKFWMSLTSSQQDFVMAHEVLHCALGHCWRRGSRQSLRWNFAADYVVDLICEYAGLIPIPGSLLDHKYEKMTVDEVYALLPEIVLLVGGIGTDIQDSGASEEEQREQAATWRKAVAQAEEAERAYGQGVAPLGKKLKIVMEDPSLRWQELIWRAVSFDRSDYGGWDRRLLSSEIYVEDLDEGLGIAEVAAFVDTSGSTEGILGRFISELKALASLYSREIPMYFDDAELIGPIPLSEIEEPIGGGGTSFVPAFDEVAKMGYAKVLYFTDLAGTFPKHEPDAEVLWVVPAGTTIVPPFGRVAKII